MEAQPRTEINTETSAGWQAGNAQPPEGAHDRKRHPVFRGVLLLLVVLAAVAGAAAMAYRTGVWNLVFHPMAASLKLGHFYSNDTPEMSKEGIKGVITEAYYTNDRHFALVLTLSNGLSTGQALTSIDVTVKNEDGKIIASGFADTSSTGYAIRPMGTGTFTFYISPDYVQIPNDDLGQLSYVIATTGKTEDLSGQTAGTSTTTGTAVSAADGTGGTTTGTGAASASTAFR